MPAPARRVRVRAEGTDQGVGFRPWIYRLATESGVAGYVLNDERGVLLEAEGAPAGVERLVVRVVDAGEGQAAVELEAAHSPAQPGSYPLAVVDGDAGLLLDARETVQAVARDAAAGIAPAIISARFHAAVTGATAEACAMIGARRATDTVALSGGVFQNRTLLQLTGRRLIDAGLRVLTPRELPPNDGGIAYGQAAVAIAATRDHGPASSAQVAR